MKSRLLRPFKPLFAALFLIVIVLGGLEIGLRVHDSLARQAEEETPVDRGLVVRSWSTHSSLRPLTQVMVRSPDSNAPISITTNSHGLRGPEIELPKPSGVFRVVCMGDESVFAQEVELERTWGHQLQVELQKQTGLKVEVVNAGIPGFCPLLSLLQMRHSLLSLHADLFVLHFDMNDIADDHKYRRYVRLTDGLQPLICPHPDLGLAPPKEPAGGTKCLSLCWCRHQLAKASWNKTESLPRREIDLPTGRYAWLRDQPPDWSIYIGQALEPIQELSQLAEKSFARLIVVTTPAPWQVSATASDGLGVREEAGVPAGAKYSSRFPFETLGNYCLKNHILFLDASLGFQGDPTGDRLYLKNAPRMSEKGHDLLARQLAPFVVQNITGPWTNGSMAPPPARQASFETLPARQ